jgi:gliding motility-associated-like protein
MGCYQNNQFLWAHTFTLSKEFYTSADILLNSAQDSLTVTVSNTAATGARYLLRFDLSGQLSWSRWIPSYENLQSHTAPVADGGYIWISTSPDLKPVVAKTNADGLFPACAMAPVCHLDIRDTVLKTTSPTYNFQHTVRMQPVVVSATPRVLQSEDYCPPLPLLDAGIEADSVACRQASLQFGRNPAASGYSEWQFPGVLNGLVTGVAPVVTFPDTGLFTIRHLLTLAGCTDTAEAMIRIHPVPEVELPDDNVLCPGDSLEILAAASAGAAFLWENGDQTTGRTVFEPGLYGVTVSNAQGCSDSDQMLVYPPDLPDQLLPSDTFFCESGFVTLAPDTSGGWQYAWADGNPGISRNIDETGIYVLGAMSPEGCMLDDSIAVAKRQRPEIPVESSLPDSCGRQILRVTDAGLQKIRWNTGASGNVLEINTSGTYDVTASDGFCEQTVIVAAEVERCPECFAYFPNAIRPASDGANAVFAVQTACTFSEFRMRIYDRWGALVFESRNPDQGWDGYWQGRVAPPGVYTFGVAGVMQFGALNFPFEKTGTVAVVR